MTDYELMNEATNGIRYHAWWRVPLLVSFCLLTTVLVFLSWSSIYDKTLYPPLQREIPTSWYKRANAYASSAHDSMAVSHDFRLTRNQTARQPNATPTTPITVEATDSIQDDAPLPDIDQQRIQSIDSGPRLVCYYDTSNPVMNFNDLRLSDVDANLCTHINVGAVDVNNNSLVLTADTIRVLNNDVPILRKRNNQLKVLLWVGGGNEVRGFPEMIKKHATRKLFIQSLKQTLRQFALDGIDLDWEFPSAYNKERQHFSQLLYEIKQEYKRERRDYLLTVAVAAPEGIAFFAYDVRELNAYADFVNLMSYDYHFYSRGTPFTGLNAPLYARANERSILATLNINYSVNWWLTNGLDPKKLVVGLPTYGHSFTLVNPFNTRIGAPAQDMGRAGSKGFVTFSETCWFSAHNFIVSTFYDQAACSPFLSANSEWISYENVQSMECKAQFIKSKNLGGAMIFSLNTDDHKNVCDIKLYERNQAKRLNATFPLAYTVKRVLFQG